MTDSLNYNGLTTKTNSELLSEIQTSLQAIYSPDGEAINFDSNTPDGQFTQILANIGTVHRELLTGIYNATDPSKCDGTQQDTKYQLNYLTRKGGSWTIQNIDITVNKTVTLQGLDGSYTDDNATAYTVSDDSGNMWYLVDTTTLVQGSTTSCEFRAKEKGLIIPTVGTITNQVTIVQGVTGVNNSVSATSYGESQESNTEFRLRRERSTTNTSGNNADTIGGNILALDGVTACTVWQNNTNETDSTGTLPHYIWVIVEGGANTDIADIIYSNLAGAGTRGDVTVPISTISSQIMNINFDRPEVIGLYIKFQIKVITSQTLINEDNIKQYIDENLQYLIGENAETSKITSICANAMTDDGDNGYALNVQISSGGTATADISGSTGITSASVVSNTFQDVIGDVTDTYTFDYTSEGWTYDGNVVDISNYGISYVGTPIIGDMIMIDYTAGTWTDYIESTSIQNKFVTSTNRIYISYIEV